jgi:hypothetical protein
VAERLLVNYFVAALSSQSIILSASIALLDGLSVLTSPGVRREDAHQTTESGDRNATDCDGFRFVPTLLNGIAEFGAVD